MKLLIFFRILYRKSIKRLFKASNSTKYNVLLELYSENTTRRLVIPYCEWIKIKEWYTQPGANANSYTFFPGCTVKSSTIMKLDRNIFEIKSRRLTPVLLLLKNILYIILSGVPKRARFITAFLISAAVYAVYGTYILFEYSRLSYDMISPAVRVSSAVFMFFWLYNTGLAVLKTARVFKNKFTGVISPPDNRFTDSFIFSFILLTIFSFNTPDIIVRMIETFWNYINLYI